ncbi:MAG: DinB family protein [Dehalococcoidales bacterium]
MKANDIIINSLGENAGYVQNAIKGLTREELTWSPKPHSNTIIFLMWHLARVEDLWINRVLKSGKELYEADGWYKKFGTPAQDSGFGYDVAKLKAWPVPALQLVKDYAAAVRQTTVTHISALTEKQFDEPRDFGWSKGTVGSALSHLISEVGEHSGQIGYIKGIMKGIENPPPPPKK